MELMNSIENKAKFFSLYLGRIVEYPSVDNKIEKCKLVSVGFEYIETNYKRKRQGCVGDSLSWKNNGSHNSDALHASLQLTPLSQITDEHAIEFFDIVWSKVASHKEKPIEFKIDFGKNWAISPTSERYGLIPTGLFHGVDYLRSKGYALPFMGLSVEQLVSFGWVKPK